jgi:pimeloyl-ACP methyl ester carboxylesterase
MLHLLTISLPSVPEMFPHMQLGALSRWLKKDAPVWEGQSFTVSVEGRGRDVVFLHGLAASAECWEEAGERLGPDVRCHMVQMRGFAGLAPSALREPMNFLKPMADALAAYIRTLKAGPVAVAGHSMGGLVSLILARDHADVVERLMVVDVPAYFSVLINPFATPGTMAPLAQHSRRSYVEKSRPQLQDELYRANEKLVADPGLVERIVKWGMTSDRRTTADVMAEVMVTDLRGDLQKIAAPVDVIYAWDRVSPATKLGLDQIYASTYAGLQRGQRLRIDNARHYVMFDQPEVFYGAIREWLSR